MGSFMSITSFDPKPPPMYELMTRTLRSGMPRTRATSCRCVCGAWALVQMVRRSLLSHLAMQLDVSRQVCAT